MSKARTLMGVEYQYSGSLETGLIVHKKIDVHITADAIKLINPILQVEALFLWAHVGTIPQKDQLVKS